MMFAITYYKMPRPKKVKESDDIFEMIIDGLNNPCKKNKRENKNGFTRHENGMWINEERYVTEDINYIVIIGKMNEDNCFEYLSKKDCEYCINRGIKYNRYV